MMNASFSVRPRMYASGATSMTPACISFGIDSGSIMSCSASYSGRRYGSIFSKSVPGRKPSRSPASTAGRVRMMRVTCLVCKRLNRLRHREVRLAGARRADSEHDGVLVDRVDVALLVERLGPDRLAAARQDVEGQHLGRRLVPVASASTTLCRTASGVSASTAVDDGDQLGDDALGQRDVGRSAGQGHGVAAHVDVGGEESFECAQILVGGTEQAHHEVGRNIDAAAYGRRGGVCLAGCHVEVFACFLCSGDWLVAAEYSVYRRVATHPNASSH